MPNMWLRKHTGVINGVISEIALTNNTCLTVVY